MLLDNWKCRMLNVEDTILPDFLLYMYGPLTTKVLDIEMLRTRSINQCGGEICEVRELLS